MINETNLHFIRKNNLPLALIIFEVALLQFGSLRK